MHGGKWSRAKQYKLQCSAIKLVVGTKYVVPSTWYQVSGATHLVPSIWYQTLGTKYLVPSIWYHVPGTKYMPLPNICLRIYNTDCTALIICATTEYISAYISEPIMYVSSVSISQAIAKTGRAHWSHPLRQQRERTSSSLRALRNAKNRWAC